MGPPTFLRRWGHPRFSGARKGVAPPLRGPARIASRVGTTVPDRSDAAVPYGLDEQVRGSKRWRVVPFTVKMTRLKSPVPEGMSMVKAVVSRGEIRPLEPLPADWQEGQPLRVEKEDGDETPVEEIDRDFAVLASLCAASEPANEDQLERALREARRQAKEQVRRQMGLA